MNRLNWQCCLAGSSKTAPRILIFFQWPWVPIIHLSLFPLRSMPPNLLDIINYSKAVWNRTLWRVCFRCLLPWVKSNTNCIFFVYPQMVILQPLQNLTKRRRLKTILPFSVEHCFSGLINSSWLAKIGKLTAKMCGTWILNTGKPLSIFSCKKRLKHKWKVLESF